MIERRAPNNPRYALANQHRELGACESRNKEYVRNALQNLAAQTGDTGGGLQPDRVRMPLRARHGQQDRANNQPRNKLMRHTCLLHLRAYGVH
jgi:hypothetical protein